MVEALTKLAATVAKTLSKPPPKLFFPSYVNFKGFFARFAEAQRKGDFGGAYNKLRMESTFRKGNLVGTDYNGNKYYEDLGAPYGRTRWVEYPTPRGWWYIDNKFDGSMVRAPLSHKSVANPCGRGGPSSACVFSPLHHDP